MFRYFFVVVLATLVIGGLGYYFLAPNCALPSQAFENFTLASGPFKAGSVEFSLIRDKNKNLCLYSYIGRAGGWNRIWEKAVKQNSEFVKSAWYDKERNEMILGIVKDGKAELLTVSPSAIFGILNISGKKLEGKNVSSLRFINYYKDSRNILVESMSNLYEDKEECGLKGEVFIWDGNSQNKIQEVGERCAEYTLPRYVGFTGSKLIFAEYNQKNQLTSVSTKEKSTVKDIYSIDPLDLKKEIVIASSRMPKNVNEVDVSGEFKNLLSLFGKNEWYPYDLARKGFYKFDPAKWPRN